MGWPDYLYEVFGTKHPVASYFAVFIVAGSLFTFLWWLVGRHYQATHPLTPAPTAQRSLTAVGDNAKQNSPDATKADNTGSSRGDVVPAPLRRALPEQLATLRVLLRQMQAQRHSKMWLSQLFYAMRAGGLDGIPVGGAIDYPAALREMAAQGEIKIMESADREILDFWGEVFRKDIRFRMLKLKDNEGAQD